MKSPRYIYSPSSRFRCDPKTGIIEELDESDGYRFIPLPPVPRNWKDERKVKPPVKIKTFTEEMRYFEGGY